MNDCPVPYGKLHYLDGYEKPDNPSYAGCQKAEHLQILTEWEDFEQRLPGTMKLRTMARECSRYFPSVKSIDFTIATLGLFENYNAKDFHELGHERISAVSDVDIPVKLRVAWQPVDDQDQPCLTLTHLLEPLLTMRMHSF